MTGQANEASELHMLLLIESAQRVGSSEAEIRELVDDAIEADDELDRAA